MKRALALSALLVAISGCGADNKAVRAPLPSGDDGSRTATVAPDANNANKAEPAGPPGPGVNSSNLHVSDSIARACALPKVDYAPSFAFDQANIGPDDKDLLSALAKCLSEGALRGRGLALIGRADPRGEDEYNMVLGNARAESVRRYLGDLGVERERLRATSRGELDAIGTDEDGWARDRRVDIELASPVP